MERSNTLTVTFIWVLVLAAIGVTAWLYLVKKDYNFIVEAACDPATETCFHRDCSSDTAECPASGLEDYKVFSIKARDFEQCQGDACVAQCVAGNAACTAIPCSADDGDECSEPPVASESL